MSGPRPDWRSPLPPGRHRKPRRSSRLRRWGLISAPIVAAGGLVPVATSFALGEPTGPQRPAQSATATPAPAAARFLAARASRGLARPEPPVPRMAAVDGLADRAQRREKAEAAVKRARHESVEPTRTGISRAPCPDGSAVESGLVANAVEVYRAVCAAFPAVNAWGGRSASGEHATGRALDIMSTGSLGDAIAAYVRSHAGALRVSEVIWSQRIWTVQRAGEGWRPMSDRGSATANHYDHVHVLVY